MKKLNIVRIVLFLTTIIIVVSIATVLGMYARGYRFSQEKGITPHGLLAIKSVPTSSQVFIDGALNSVTDDTISIEPGTYDLEVRRDGFHTWKKNVKIDEGIVTQIIAQLFKSAPSLDAITFTGVVNPVPSRDLSKIAYVVPELTVTSSEEDKSGLWILETVNLPIGFSRDPRRITDGDLTNTSITWSPDDREILLDTATGSYLLDTNDFVEQRNLIELGSKRAATLTAWDIEMAQRKASQTKKLPEQLAQFLENEAKDFVISPDSDMVLYTASGSATLDDNLIPPVPGSSNQKEDRNIKVDHTYVYDIEEDRNFLIIEDSSGLTITSGYSLPETVKERLSWFPTSRNLVLAGDNKVVIMDYDATNQQEVFNSFIAPHAFPTVSDDRLIILTNFGSVNSLPNLYSVSLK